MKARVTLYDQARTILDEYVNPDQAREYDKTIEVRVPKDDDSFLVIQRKLKLVVKLGPLPLAPAAPLPEFPQQNISVSVPYMDTLVEQMRSVNDRNVDFHRRFDLANGHLSNIATNLGSFFTAQVKVVEELTAELNWERVRNQNLEAEIDRLRSLGNGKLLPVRAIRPKLLLPKEVSKAT